MVEKSLRYIKDQIKYKKLIAKKKHKECPLCLEKKVIKYFKYWKIIYSKYPYTKIAKTHHMIIPNKHITEDKLNKKEKEEYTKIKNDYIRNKDYGFIMEANQSKKSLPDHFHLHLVELK